MTTQEFMQVEQEIDAFRAILAEEGCRSFLEIGSKFGGSLRRIAKVLPAQSRVVAVDMPKGTRLWHQSEPALNKTIHDLRVFGYNAHVIWGDSTSATVVDQVRAFGPFDAVFIDANHTRAYVEQDWENYGPMARIVAFHDINWHRGPTWEGVRIDVPEFWEKVKVGYPHEEFRFCPTGKNNGIGVLWRS